MTADQAIRKLRLLAKLTSSRATCEFAIQAIGAGMSHWQPIETAPKDGTRILAWWPEWSNVGVIVAHVDKFGRWSCPSASWDDDFESRPTHWMPLPDPPRAGTVDELSGSDVTPSVSAAK